MVEKPSVQQDTFFRWFAQIGIHHFDIQLRVPETSDHGEEQNWKWLRPSKRMSTGEFFLKFSGWVKYMNSIGSDIFIRPHGEDSQSVMFLDDLPVNKAYKVANKYSACVVRTSPNYTQVWLATDRKLSKAERKSAQTHLKGLDYSDPGSTSGDHLGRICGVRSQKRGCWVNLLHASSGTKYSPPKEPLISPPLGEARASRGFTDGNPSQCERDFGWIL